MNQSSGGVHNLNKLLNNKILLDTVLVNCQEPKTMKCDLSLNTNQNAPKNKELIFVLIMNVVFYLLQANIPFA